MKKYVCDLYEIMDGKKNEIESITLSDLIIGQKIKFDDGFVYEVQSFKFDDSTDSYSVHVEPEKPYKLIIAKYNNLYYCVTNNSRCINVTPEYVTFETQDNVKWIDFMFIDEVVDSEKELLEIVKTL